MSEPQLTLQTKITLKIIPAHCFGQVIRLHRAVFEAGQVASTIYAGHGIARYLASLAAYPQFQLEDAFWGAWDGDDLIGYAHFRALPGSWHLNNIAIRLAYQGLGIGNRLWRRFVDTARERQNRTVTLDVDSSNLAAIGWYRRKGLEVSGATWRYQKKTPPAVSPIKESIQLVGWEQAEAWQTAYGFSQFQIRLDQQAWNIGRIGEHYFKADQRLPAAVEAALAEIDPSRRLLVASNNPLYGSDLTLLGKSLRMQGALP